MILLRFLVSVSTLQDLQDHLQRVTDQLLFFFLQQSHMCETGEKKIPPQVRKYSNNQTEALASGFFLFVFCFSFLLSVVNINALNTLEEN